MKRLITGFMIALLLIPACAFARTLTFATDPFPPFYYEEDGTPKGIQYELAKIVFSKMQTRFKIVFVPWKRALLMAESGKVDGVFGLRKTKERLRWMIYPDEPLMEVNTVIFKRVDSPFEYTGISALKGKKIGIIKGYTYGKEFDESTLFKKEEVADLRHNFLKMLAGRIDMVAAYRAVGIHVLNQMGLQGQIIPCPGKIHVSPLYIGFSKEPGNGKISREFSRILNEFKKSDECKELMQRLDIPQELISPCQ
ncbi:ABC transporter substrate-binding protein [Desulfovibrio sp. JC010]|uniref:substrate-binding periplasmic protein n=1 Tax=Desulfovibrio sp. JC010 TaxID=2593641 RepID=UPI0013CF7868|nr:transporter substrate-binding domain-containing protein [Desulfovibrio sp. JC010]NDV26405.1 amino acid ABC transporter substrate-binding protein [Desulfovibrio sp. JC010]